MLYIMKQVKISSKNQITLPNKILARHGISAGHKLYIVDSPEGITLTTQNPLEQFFSKAHNTPHKPLGDFDPIKHRSDLRHEWNDNEQDRTP